MKKLVVSAAIVAALLMAPVAAVFIDATIPATGNTATYVVDGDTLDTSDGDRTRLRGIDTPERGECGYAEASDRLAELVLGESVTLTGDERGRWDRRIAYVDGPEGDAGLTLIAEGYAIARYDSRDGYPLHPRQTEYIAADMGSQPAVEC